MVFETDEEDGDEDERGSDSDQVKDADDEFVGASEVGGCKVVPIIILKNARLLLHTINLIILIEGE